MTEQARWLRVRDVDVPADGRVRSVVVDGRSIAMSRCGGRLGALENKCPHQGGPLGEESIEKGLLRCRWHGYDYDPLTGLPPEGFADAVPGYPVQERPDGVYVALPEVQTSPRTVADVRVETLVAFGVRGWAADPSRPIVAVRLVGFHCSSGVRADLTTAQSSYPGARENQTGPTRDGEEVALGVVLGVEQASGAGRNPGRDGGASGVQQWHDGRVRQTCRSVLGSGSEGNLVTGRGHRRDRHRGAERAVCARRNSAPTP
jgi:nitrite reductase/ring-hydroxylating ferredoxin subunit